MNRNDIAIAEEPSAPIWTREEIGDLVSPTGSPAETLTNVVHLIQRAVRDRRLLRLPARARSREPRAGGHDRPAARERGPRAHAAHRGAGRPRRRTGPARRRARHDHAPAVQVLPGRRRGPLSDLPRRAADGPRRPAGRARRADGGSAHLRRRRRAHAGDGRRPAGADRQRGARGRAVRRAGPPAAGRDRPEPLVELGRRERRACFATWTRSSGGRAITIRSRCCSARRSISSSCAHRSSRCTAASTRRTGGCRSIWRRSTRGAPGTPACSARGRWRTSRRSSACTSRFRSTRAASASSPATTSRARPTSASRSSGSGCTTTRATSGSGSIATAGSTRSTSTSITGVLPIQPATHDGVPVTVEIETRTGRIVARVWRIAVGRNTLLLLDSNVDGNSPEDRELTARLYGGDQRIRIRQELLLGVGGVRALAALGISPGVVHLNEGHSAFASLELVRRRMDVRGDRRGRGDAPRRVAGRLHHAHAGAGRARSLLRGRSSRSTSDRCATRSGCRAEAFLALGRVDPRQPRRGVLHDGARAQDRVIARTPCPRCTASVSRGDVEAALSRPCARSSCRSATSPTASTCARGWRRRCASSTTGISAPAWAARSSDTLWEAIESIDDGELWETHQTLKTRLIQEVRRRAVQQAAAPGRAAGGAGAAAAGR